MKGQIVFVVGCPRSGTSPFSRWLEKSGLATVRDDRRHERYPAGYQEHMPILMFHKALERLPRGAEHAITTEPFLESAQLEDPFIRTVFEAAFAPVLRGEVDFIKFPQLALSIDFLIEQFPDAKVIGIWRDPLPTFRSLITKEFPAEMRPASGLKAIFFWNLYAHHLTRAKEAYPDAVRLVEIDAFLADPEVGRGLLAWLGRDPGKAAAISDAIDVSLWHRSIGIGWRAYHALMSWVARASAGRVRSDRRVLADQRAWRDRLARLTRASR